jgi:hypothetical protein
MCCYDKILVNVAAYVYFAPRTHTHLTKNYICGHIYQDFIITTHYYIVFYHLIIRNFS